jgi:hypothetical protein
MMFPKKQRESGPKKAEHHETFIHNVSLSY